MSSANLAPVLPYFMDYFRNSAGNDLYEQARLKEQSGDYTPIKGSWLVDPKETAAANDKLRLMGQQREAMPLLQRIANIQQDPQFQTEEGLKELQSDPNFWLGTDGNSSADVGIKVNNQNPQMASAIPSLRASAGTQSDILQGYRDTQEGKPMAPEVFARLANLDQATGKDGVKTMPIVDKMLALAKQNEDMRKTRGMQDWVNASAGIAGNEGLAKLAQAAQYGATPEQLATMAKVYGVDPAKLETVEAGDANGRDVRYVFDPRTGKTVGVVGSPQDPTRKATRVAVSNFLPAQETAFAKGVGEANAKQYSEAIASKGNAKSGLQTLTDLQSALKDAPAGWTAGYQYEAMKRLNPNSKQVAAYEVARNKQQELSLNLLQNFKGAMSDKELKFVEEMSVNPNMTRAAQKRLIDIARSRYKSQINSADTLIRSVESDPVRSNINKTLKENERPPLSGFVR
jgi:hypothetical protein